VFSGYNYSSAAIDSKGAMTKGKRRRKREQAQKAAAQRKPEGMLAGANDKAEGDRIQERHSQATKQESKDERNMPTKAEIAQGIRENANVVIAVFTIVIAAAAILQVCVYRSQLTWLRIDERAWLAVKFTPFYGPAVNNKVLAPILTMNIGKTVAKDVEGWIFFRPVPIATTIDLSEYKRVEPSSLPSGEPIPAWTTFKTGVIFPSDQLPTPQVAIAKTPTGSDKPEAFTWDQPSQDQWLRGDIYLAVHGKITYKDAAGNPHWTTFCNVFMAPNTGKNVSKDTSDACIRYNTVDDQ
jgi:hypothetical protein